jgi:hypothetical protein
MQVLAEIAAAKVGLQGSTLQGKPTVPAHDDISSRPVA